MPLIESSGSSGGGGGSGTVTNVSSADTSIVVTNPTTTPSLKVGTMDVLFTNEPPAASVPMNTQKLTGLAAGTVNGDSVRFEQALKSGAVTAADTSIVVAGTGVAPTIATGTLDVIATNHPPAASVPMNTQKLTGLAAGTVNGDSVRFEQALKSGAVTAADTSIVVAGTGVAPTIATGTLDVIATNHPPAAAVALNAKKITGLANGSAATDAAAFGQIPTVLVPKTAAGIGETIDRGSTSLTTLAVLLTQRLTLVSIQLPAGLLITSISFASGGTALSGGNHQLFGLFDDTTGHETGTARALLRGTNDDTSTAWGANTVKTLNLTATYTTLVAGLFYIGVLVDAGTVPTLAGGGGANALISGIVPIRSGSSTTAITALPNPAAAITAQAGVPFASIA